MQSITATVQLKFDKTLQYEPLHLTHTCKESEINLTLFRIIPFRPRFADKFSSAV
jgi:hypothetical protein